MSYGLVIRERDGKCRAVDEDNRNPLTGWCKDGMSVYAVMKKKEKRRHER